LPVITEVDAGTASIVTTARVTGGPEPHELEGVTVIFPDELAVVTLIVFVPCPEIIIQPAGTVQV